MATTPERRGARQRLTQQRIVEAALELIDEQGMAAVTMRTLAARLHVEAMSLYKHVANRDKLFDAVVDRIVGELADNHEVSAEPLQGWRSYLSDIAHGVRRYARAHPHAFPLVATRPTEAPWINPPLRSVDWIEAFLRGLEAEGFSDAEVLFAYRSFNSFLLGFLLLETSAMALSDPRPGDGAYATTEAAGSDEATAAEAAVPGGLTPTRSRADRRAIARAESAGDLIDPQGELDPGRYPTIHRLADGLAEDHFETEFQLGLEAMLDQIAAIRSESGGHS
ncbi:TetR/AcrR family transcriptional regulator [Jatrophihabitans sp.]|uniref:TetR/AcrR family transcriptional regulator n=1 Tax=Jatrophihabitans sp. TaxID=1932789 RepID=UPI002CE3B2C4|nr:TetR family transcriptional regulator [Jatrophihabitans sp.]